jgi:hypothetical protein
MPVVNANAAATEATQATDPSDLVAHVIASAYQQRSWHPDGVSVLLPGVSAPMMKRAIRCVSIVFCVFMTADRRGLSRQGLSQSRVDLLRCLFLHARHHSQAPKPIRTADSVKMIGQSRKGRNATLKPVNRDTSASARSVVIATA